VEALVCGILDRVVGDEPHITGAAEIGDSAVPTQVALVFVRHSYGQSVKSDIAVLGEVVSVSSGTNDAIGYEDASLWI